MRKIALTASLAALAAPAGAQLQKLLADDVQSVSGFGSVTAFSAEEVVLGAPYDDDLGDVAGAVYVYAKSLGHWVQVEKLFGSDTTSGDQFGAAADATEDFIVVGAPLQISDGGAIEGAAYVFERGVDGWTEIAKLTPSGVTDTQRFGMAVAIDGDTILVGAPGQSAQLPDYGEVFVFEYDGAAWSQTAILRAADQQLEYRFGEAVDLDGSVALIGARHADLVGTNSGAAYVFERIGALWVERAKLVASDSAALDNFGESVALREGHALVGALWRSDVGWASGAAYVFELDGAIWNEVAKLVPGDVEAGDEFGGSVAWCDGRAIVGACQEDEGGPSAGAIYVFEEGEAGWVEREKILSSDPQPWDQFGAGIRARADLLVAGATGHDQVTFDGGASFAANHPFGDLQADVGALSVGAGGVQTLTLDAGPAYAGLTYVVLGTATATAPAILSDGVEIPLFPDAYFVYTLASAGHPPLSGGLGVLDAAGRATARFTLPPAAPASLLGLQLHHAAVVVELLPTLLQVAYASNPVSLGFAP